MAAKITYYPEAVWPHLQIKTQAVSSADRPHCALTAALACWQEAGRPAPRKGVIKGPALADATDAEAVGQVLAREFGDQLVDWDRATFWARSLRRAIKLDPVECVTSVVNSEGKQHTLDSYQIEAMEMLTPAGGGLDLDTGLGKTATGVCYALSVAAQKYAAPSRCWILCPLNAIPTWTVWVDELSAVFADVRIVSVDSAHKLTGDGGNGGVLLLDEAHYLGGGRSRRTKAATELRKSFDSCVCMTGTFLHGGIERTLPVLDLAIPGAAVFASSWKCGARFDCIVQKQRGTRTMHALEKPRRSLRSEYFEYLALFVVSQDKSDDRIRAQIGLGDIDQEVITEQVGDNFGRQKEIDLWVQSAIELAGGDPTQPPNAEVNAELEWPHATAVMHAMARAGLDAKIEWIADHMDDTDLPLVISAFYSESLDRLACALDAAGVSFVRVDGDVVGSERNACMRAFQRGEVDVFLGQMIAASVSMNLQCSCVSVAVDHCRVASAYYQFLGRTYRRGQTRDCVHIDLVANDLQKAIVARLREHIDFDASCSEWQRLKRLNDEMRGGACA